MFKFEKFIKICQENGLKVLWNHNIDYEDRIKISSEYKVIVLKLQQLYLRVKFNKMVEV